MVTINIYWNFFNVRVKEFATLVSDWNKDDQVSSQGNNSVHYVKGGKGDDIDQDVEEEYMPQQKED